MSLTFPPQIGLKPTAQVDTVIGFQDKTVCEACNLTLKQGRNKIRQEPVGYTYTLSAAEKNMIRKIVSPPPSTPSCEEYCGCSSCHSTPAIKAPEGDGMEYVGQNCIVE